MSKGSKMNGSDLGRILSEIPKVYPLLLSLPQICSPKYICCPSNTSAPVFEREKKTYKMLNMASIMSRFLETDKRDCDTEYVNCELILEKELHVLTRCALQS